MPKALAKNMVLIMVRLPRQLVVEIDELVKRRGYASRTEFIRESVRRELREEYYSKTVDRKRS